MELIIFDEMFGIWTVFSWLYASLHTFINAVMLISNRDNETIGNGWVYLATISTIIHTW